MTECHQPQEAVLEGGLDRSYKFNYLYKVLDKFVIIVVFCLFICLFLPKILVTYFILGSR